MAISQSNLKLLWGRAASRCAICRRELTQDKAAVDGAFTIGEQAHIVSEQLNGPRGSSILDASERDSYSNLILLCPTDHAVVDNDPDAYPIEKLHELKFQHEMWVQQTLATADNASKLADDLVCTHIVDLAVKLCRLDDWEEWTNGALFSEPRWNRDFPEQIEEFRHEVVKAVWPAHNEGQELQRALQTLAFCLHEAAQTFLDHAAEEGAYMVPRKFYKDQWYAQKEYYRRVRIYEDWLHDCQMLVIEATKAANWFGDVVRRDLNPAFFVDRGRFVVTSSFINKGNTILLEFTSEEKSVLPDSFVLKRKRKQKQHRSWWKKLTEPEVDDAPD
jgi:hypothetical protein